MMVRLIHSNDIKEIFHQSDGGSRCEGSTMKHLPNLLTGRARATMDEKASMSS